MARICGSDAAADTHSSDCHHQMAMDGQSCGRPFKQILSGLIVIPAFIN